MFLLNQYYIINITEHIFERRISVKICKDCIHYDNGICKKDGYKIFDMSGAKNCQYYIDKEGNTNKAQCIYCKFLNTADWCFYKRRCLSEKEKKKERYCVNFRKRGGKKNQQNRKQK